MDRIQQSLKPFQLDRFGQVPIKTGLQRPLAVFFGAVTCHGHDHHPGRGRLISQMPGDLIAIHPRQANIQQYDLG